MRVGLLRKQELGPLSKCAGLLELGFARVRVCVHQKHVPRDPALARLTTTRELARQAG